MKTLNTMSINTETFFEENDVDLSCRTCEGTGEGKPDAPEGVVALATEEWHCGECHADIEKDAPHIEHEEAPGVPGALHFCDRACLKEWWDENGWFDENSQCEDCGGEGRHEIMMNTIWDTGFSADSSLNRNRGLTFPVSIGPIVAFDHDGNIWFGMSGGGMDLSPHFCKAWIELFPDCSWIPHEWISLSDLFGNYYDSAIGTEMTKRVVALYKASLESDIRSAQCDLGRVNEYLAKKQGALPDVAQV